MLVKLPRRLTTESQQILQVFKQYVFAHSNQAMSIAIDTFQDLLFLREKYEKLNQQKLILELQNRELKQKIANIQRIIDGE